MLRRLLLRQTLSLHNSPPSSLCLSFFKHIRRWPYYNNRFDGDSALFPAVLAVNMTRGFTVRLLFPYYYFLCWSITTLLITLIKIDNFKLRKTSIQSLFRVNFAIFFIRNQRNKSILLLLFLMKLNYFLLSFNEVFNIRCDENISVYTSTWQNLIR